MANTKLKRNTKQQLGQFMTPLDLCLSIVKDLPLTKDVKILEPSFGTGNFIISLINKLLPLYEGNISSRVEMILKNNIYGIELDTVLYNTCLKRIEEEFGKLPLLHNLVNDNFLLKEVSNSFDFIVGNPPFGGSIETKDDVFLEKKYGKRDKIKIKKETYSFFMIKSVELLKNNGCLVFISSDTFLTIKTMTGLRKFLYKNGLNNIKRINFFSDETEYPMLIITHSKNICQDYIIIDDNKISFQDMNLTENFSWNITTEYSKYFKGKLLSEYITSSGGMTTGNNELFLREITNGQIEELYDFNFIDEKITIKESLEKARNNTLSETKIKELKKQEENNKTYKKVLITKKEKLELLSLPNKKYKFYNKASNEIFYSKPYHVIYWDNEGEAVLNFKKTGNWYLHGVGGQSFFNKKGITWQLISSKINARFLPEGFILDNSSPISILKPNTDEDELYFIMGWLLTEKCTELLKKVINHTKNIQGKDIERLPYPFWVNNKYKEDIVNIVKKEIDKKINDKKTTDNILQILENLFVYN